MAVREEVGLTFDTVLDTVSAPDSIVNYAVRHNFDLIVIGTTGKTVIRRFLLGSVASGVVTDASSPVLVTR